MSKQVDLYKKLAADHFKKKYEDVTKEERAFIKAKRFSIYYGASRPLQNEQSESARLRRKNDSIYY